jgi:hypothetical protein
LIFPNPVQDQLNISSQFPIVDFEVLDMQGRVMMTENVGGFQDSISMASLPSGMYMLRLNTTQGFVVKRFVKS